MYCPECGCKNVDGAAYCENCGTKLAGIPGNVKQNGTFEESQVQNAGEYTAGAAAASKAKKGASFTKLNKALLIEIPVAIISLVIFIMVFQAKFSAKNVVERYVEGMGNGNWNQVYDTLYLKDSGDFMSKQAFVTAQTINGTKWDEDLEVQNVRKKTGSIYRVKYEGGNGIQRIDVKVKRSGLTWKVDEADTFLAKNFSVAVPKDAEIKIDGIKPDSKLKSQDEIEGMDTYTIKKMFGTSHYVEISGADIETTSAVLESYDEPVVMTAGYSKKSVEKVADQAVKDLDSIFQGAAANKRFSDIDILNNMYADEKDSVIRKYESARDDYFDNGDDSWEFLNYTISNCEAQAQMVTRDQKQLIEVTIKGDAKWEKNYVYFSGDKEKRTESEDAEHTLYYIDDNGTRKLYDLDLWTW